MDLIEKTHLNEDCYCCNKAKFKQAPFPRNEGSYVAVAEPYFRLYVDGFGGQKSLGNDSIEGAKGGIVCVCPVSGSIILKLYATLKQFPAILYQVLQEVERQGFICREIMVNTFVANLSAAAEEVAAMFKTRIVPISAGTPQELAYAERAVRTIGERSRALLLGAPHLPNHLWGLADIHAANIHDVLPQPDRANKSPYAFRHGRQPNIDHLHLKVFGCPCQYSPIDGPEHKRASKTEWGYYVGMQWPMCLVYKAEDNTVLSVSRKKLVCHEGMYAYFDPTKNNIPKATITELDTIREISKIQQAHDKNENQEQDPDNENNLKGVHSIKVLRESTMNEDFNEALPPPPTTTTTTSLAENQGENHYSPFEIMDEDSLQEKVKEFKIKAKENPETQYQKIIEALENIRVEKRQLPSPREDEYGADVNAKNILKERRNRKDAKRKAEIQIGDEVRIKTIKFGKQYAKGRPKYIKGKVVSIKGKKAGVVYDGEEEVYDTDKGYLEKMLDDSAEGDVCATVCYKGNWYKKTQTFYTIMATLEVGSALKRLEENEEANWPKDIFEALIRSDWRDWVLAVQKENESWRTFNASEEVRYVDMVQGASIIPLGELYTIKRTGQHMFRQYAMGNLLKAGKDYGDTFSSTVSGDGLRWFCALAAACNKRIKGWDATTGYLQTKQRIKVYTYLPSHHGYSDSSLKT